MKRARSILLLVGAFGIAACGNTNPPADVPGDVQNNDVQNNDVQGNDVQGNDVQGNDVQNTDVQNNDVQSNDVQSTDAATDAAADVAVDAAPPGDGGTVHTVEVGAAGFSFSPSTLTINAGDTVRWVWRGSFHNVVSGSSCTADNMFCSPSNSSCGAAPTSNTGDMYERRFMTSGTFPYFCAPHCAAGMTGTITVR